MKPISVSLHRKRNAISVVECIIASGLLLAAMVTLSQMLVLVQHQRSRLERRRLISTELAHWAERVAAVDTSELTAEKLLALPSDERFQRDLPSAKRSVRLRPAPAGGAVGTEIELAIDLPSEVSLKLICWRFPREPASAVATPAEVPQ